MKVDAVITELEFQLETQTSPYGHYVVFRFVDVFPYFTKVNEMVSEIEKRQDVYLVNYEMTYTGIHEDTDMTGLERIINWKGVDCSTPKQRDILLYEKKRSI